MKFNIDIYSHFDVAIKHFLINAIGQFDPNIKAADKFMATSLSMSSEYKNAGTSIHTIMTKKVISNKQITQIISDIACALNSLHDNDVVHGNISTSSIVIEKGVAKLLPYRCPAIIEPPLAYNESKETDIWTLGAVWLAMLTNDLNYCDWDESLANIYNTMCKWADRFKYGDLIKRMVEIDPAKRITAKQLCAALRRPVVNPLPRALTPLKNSKVKGKVSAVLKQGWHTIQSLGYDAKVMALAYELAIQCINTNNTFSSYEMTQIMNAAIYIATYKKSRPKLRDFCFRQTITKVLNSYVATQNAAHSLTKKRINLLLEKIIN